MTSKCPKADNWCTTELETIKTSFQWVINNFNEWTFRCKTGQQIQSSTFSSDKDIKTKWYLSVYPNGDTEGHKEFVLIFINLKESDMSEVLAEYSIGIVDSNQQIHNQSAKSKQNFKLSKGWGYTIRRSQLENPERHLLPNNVLTLYCEIMYFGECQTNSGQNITIKRSHQKLLDDMTALYQNPDDSDVEIVVEEQKFSAHKLILKARSPVFAAMFKHEMKENLQNKVDIKDIEKEVFSKVLRYIYTDSVVNEDIDSNIQLLSAADKYDLNDLKSICEEYIGSQLTVESVSDVLILADNHSTQELKGKAIDFIKKNRNEVTKTKGWKKVIDRSDLLQLF